MRKLVISALVAIVTAACGQSSTTQNETQKAPPKAESELPLGQLSSSVEPKRYRLDLTINPDQVRYEGTVEIEVELKAPKREIYLHGLNLEVGKAVAKVMGKEIPATYAQVHETGIAKLTFQQQIPRGTSVLRIEYKTPFEPSPDALTSVADQGSKYAWTQFEPISARRAFPSFDEPRFKTPFDISITAIKRDRVISNTMEILEEVVTDGVRKVTFATTAPLPTYLVAIAVGPYDVVAGPVVPPNALRTTPLPLRAVTVAGKGNRSRFALNNTPKLITDLENYFAAPFPYPKLDLIAPPNFLAGGMENAGAITYTERGILLDDGSSIQQKRNFTLLHAHELAHQWFGDLVTPKWWNDIWLNESFATWMGNKASSKTWPQGEFERETIRDALDVMETDALASARAIRQPIASNGDIYNAFDGLTYRKGGGVLSMFEAFLGEDVFREGVRLHMRKFAHGNADVRDFMESLAQASRRPEVTQAFESFLNQPGVPLIRLKSACKDRDLETSITQSVYGATSPADNRRWSVPVCMRDLSKARSVACVISSQAETVLSLKGMCGAKLFPNKDGAGYFRFSMDNDEWSDLVANFAKLTPGEQISSLHSLRAAFRAGEAKAATYLLALEKAAATQTWDVTKVTATLLLEIKGDLISEKHWDQFEQRTRHWISQQLDRLAMDARAGEAPSKALQRASLADWAVNISKHPAALSALATRGQAMLKAMNPNEKARATSDIALPAMQAAISTGGSDAARDAIDLMATSTEAEFRNLLLRALASAKDATAVSDIRTFVLSGTLRAREISAYLRTAFTNPQSRLNAWAWLQKDFNKITAPYPKDARTNMIHLTERLCHAGADKEIEAFFKPKLKDLPGGERALANALETVNRCLSWRKSSGAEITAALVSP